MAAPQSCPPNSPNPTWKGSYAPARATVRMPKLKYRVDNDDEPVPPREARTNSAERSRPSLIPLSTANTALGPSLGPSFASNSPHFLDPDTPNSFVDIGPSKKKKKKKTKSGLAHFFTTKEPSTSAFADYQDEQRRLTARKPSAVGSFPNVSQQKLPSHVPKVNSKWDGLPNNRRDATASEGSSGRPSHSSKDSTKAPTQKSEPIASTGRASGAVRSSRERWSSFGRPVSSDRSSKTSAFERPNGALQLYGQPDSPYGDLTRSTPPRSPGKRFAAGTSPSSIPRLLQNPSSGEISRLELQSSPGATRPQSLDGVHTSPERPPKLPKDIDVGLLHSPDSTGSTTDGVSLGTPEHDLPITPTRQTKQSDKSVSAVNATSPNSDTKLQWPLKESMTRVVLNDSGYPTIGPEPAPTPPKISSPKRVVASHHERAPSTDTLNSTSTGVEYDAIAVTLKSAKATSTAPNSSPSVAAPSAPRPRNFARPFTSSDKPPEKHSVTATAGTRTIDSYFPPVVKDAASVAGPVFSSPVRPFGGVVVNNDALTPIQEVDTQSMVSIARDSNPNITIQSSSDEEGLVDTEDEEGSGDERDNRSLEVSERIVNQFKNIELEAYDEYDEGLTPPTVHRYGVNHPLRLATLGSGDGPDDFLISDDGTPYRYVTLPDSYGEGASPNSPIITAVSTGQSQLSPAVRNKSAKELRIAALASSSSSDEPDSPTPTPSIDFHPPSPAEVSKPSAEDPDYGQAPNPAQEHSRPDDMASRASISSELSARHYQSPRERLGLGGFIKHDRAGGVPWPTGAPEEDADYVVGEGVRASREEMERRLERKADKEKKKSGPTRDSRRKSGGWAKGWGRR